MALGAFRSSLGRNARLVAADADASPGERNLKTPKIRKENAPISTEHPTEVRQAYDRLLTGGSVRSRFVKLDAGGRVHLLEKGSGPEVVLLHGSGDSAGFFLPLLNEFQQVRALALDRPGMGLSDPVDLPRDGYRESAVGWLDQILDVLELDTATLLGHSGGGMWALWYALAHPERVARLIVIGPPALPNTRCPLPMRLAATPGLGALLSRLLPPSPKSVLQFAHYAAREGETLGRYPDLIDLMVAVRRDPIADRVTSAELRVFLSPFALLSRSGFRGRSRVQPDELRRVAMPTLVIWGEHERLGSADVARAATELIPYARLEVPPTGHAPWLGQPAQTAAAVIDFVQ
jgi:2-hydroxy-6-oxonona-2,4-dienedioate hydrolase